MVAAAVAVVAAAAGSRAGGDCGGCCSGGDGGGGARGGAPGAPLRVEAQRNRLSPRPAVWQQISELCRWTVMPMMIVKGLFPNVRELLPLKEQMHCKKPDSAFLTPTHFFF